MAVLSVMDPFWQYSMPEFELEGKWTIEIFDDTANNSINSSTYMINGFDGYVQSVSIPQLSFDYDTTDYGMPTFKEKSPYDEITINFYDDVNGSCQGFFLSWLHTIYDENNNCLKRNWRYEAKDILVKYYRLLETRPTTISNYMMRRCLPKSLSEVSAEEESGERKTFSVTLITQKVETTTQKNKTQSEKKINPTDTDWISKLWTPVWI